MYTYNSSRQNTSKQQENVFDNYKNVSNSETYIMYKLATT